MRGFLKEKRNFLKSLKMGKNGHEVAVRVFYVHPKRGVLGAGSRKVRASTRVLTRPMVHSSGSFADVDSGRVC